MYGAEQPDEQTDRAMFYTLRDILAEKGFARYEISNFAKPGYECRHNLKYWRVEEYIGLGVAAHSFYQGMRFSNDESIGRYLAALRRGKRAEISRMKADLPFGAHHVKNPFGRGIARRRDPWQRWDAQIACKAAKNGPLHAWRTAGADGSGHGPPGWRRIGADWKSGLRQAF